MPIGIDDETETTDLVFAGRNEEPALLGLSVPVAAEGRDNLHMTVVMFGPDGGDHDPVAGVPRMKGTPILFMRLAGREHGYEDRFPGIGPAVFHGLLGATPFEAREEMRKA